MAERVKLEIAANALESALAAQAGGADRVELCENLGEGGCTPSYGTLTLARERLSIPLYVLIRPRGGDFVYSPAEWEAMRRDVALCVRLGCDGVVIGALTAGGEIDSEGCASLVAAAGPLGVTFHRAFDSVRDPRRALEQIIALGCERVLTSGTRTTWPNWKPWRRSWASPRRSPSPRSPRASPTPMPPAIWCCSSRASPSRSAAP